MSNFILTPNMNLPEPIVGTAPGPEYAVDVNSCLTIIDGHDHSTGSGVPINPSGININSDLTFNDNNATQFRSVRFFPQGSPLSLASDLGCLYESGVDLYYNDGLGNIIRITQSGGITGTPGSISNLTPPANVNYVSGNQTFVFQSAVNTPGNLDFGFAIFRNNVASSKGLTLQPPASMASDYVLTLPPLPVTQNIMTLDAAGNIVAAWNVDNSTLTVVSNTIKVANQGITATQIANNTITRAQEAAVGQQISGSSGALAITSASYVDVTNQTVTITTTGRPVMLMIIPDGTTDGGFGNEVGFIAVAAGQDCYFRILTNGSDLVYSGAYVGSESLNFTYLDTPTAGTYTYKIQVKISASSGTWGHTKLVAYEL